MEKMDIMRWYIDDIVIFSHTQFTMRVEFERKKKQVIWRLLPIGNKLTSSSWFCIVLLYAMWWHDIEIPVFHVAKWSSRARERSLIRTNQHHQTIFEKKVTDRILIASFSTFLSCHSAFASATHAIRNHFGALVYSSIKLSSEQNAHVAVITIAIAIKGKSIKTCSMQLIAFLMRS